MNNPGIRASAAAAAVLTILTGCAAIEESISPPDVGLTSIKLEKLSYSGQTFKLHFDVSNPNAFPLPVNQIEYGVKLDGHRFASGRSACDILVPARGDSEIEISVDLDLLKTAPALLSVVRNANRSGVTYAIEGQVALDIPATRPLRFEQSGRIQMTSALD